LLGRIEQSYGVPGEVLVAIWGLETDFGANIGKISDPAFAGDAGLRLPAIGNVPDRADWTRCASSSAAISRRQKCAARGPAKSADPVHAVVLH